MMNERTIFLICKVSARSVALLLGAFLVFVQALGGYSWAQEKLSSTSGFRWPEGKKAALSLTFDDARVSQIDQGLPFFATQSAKITFYVNPGALQQRLEGWKRVKALGHEIANHTIEHPCSGNFSFARKRSKELENYSIDRMRQELLDANRIIHDLLDVTPTTFAYPCGQKYVGRGRLLQSTVPLVAELFQAGRGYNDESTNDPAFCDPAQLRVEEAIVNS